MDDLTKPFPVGRWIDRWMTGSVDGWSEWHIDRKTDGLFSELLNEWI